jgi:hypothetical protein
MDSADRAEQHRGIEIVEPTVTPRELFDLSPEPRYPLPTFERARSPTPRAANGRAILVSASN